MNQLIEEALARIDRPKPSRFKRIVMNTLKFLLLLLLVGCGGDYVLSGNATITHKVEINIDAIDRYCKELHPDDEEAFKECVDELVVGLLKAMGET